MYLPALFLRFVVLMLRLNIYDLLDDLIESYYIPFVDFSDEEYFPEGFGFDFAGLDEEPKASGRFRFLTPSKVVGVGPVEEAENAGPEGGATCSTRTTCPGSLSSAEGLVNRRFASIPQSATLSCTWRPLPELFKGSASILSAISAGGSIRY